MELTYKDRKDLKYAKNILENPGLAAKVMNYIGVPIAKGVEMLPKDWSVAISMVTKQSLEKAILLSLSTLGNQTKSVPRDFFHKMMVAATGAAGGALGLPGLAIELPISTCIMLRSIGDIARSHGEQLWTPEAQIACMVVFALGGPSMSDDNTESAYYIIRTALAMSVAEAATFVTEKGFVQEGLPVLLRLINQLALRFEINVTEKLAAQAVPVIGAVGGAVINTMFIDHFQDMAHGHFIIRRLERTYSPEFIRSEYDKC
jgi:hypothetical protein